MIFPVALVISTRHSGFCIIPFCCDCMEHAAPSPFKNAVVGPQFRGPFLEGSEKFLHPGSPSKSPNHLITALFFSCILNMNKSLIQTRRFTEAYAPFCFLDTDQLRMA